MKLSSAGRCPVSGRLRYPSRKIAKGAMKVLRSRGLPKYGVYRCSDCCAWHHVFLRKDGEE